MENDSKKVLQIWTDGSCTPSTDSGGVGVVFVYNGKIVHEIAESYSSVTNNQMEIMAIATAFRTIDRPIDRVEIFTDSQYCLGILTKGWKMSTNFDWWKVATEAIKQASAFFKEVQYFYTKGHDKDAFNNRADVLATVASGFRKVTDNFEIVTYTEPENPSDKQESKKEQTMIESGYYPPGAEFDPNAPYNQVDPPETEVGVLCSETLSKSAICTTTDYTLGGCYRGEDGFAEHEPDDFSNTDFSTVWNEEHMTPLQLIELLKSLSMQELDWLKNTRSVNAKDRQAKINYWEHIKSECSGWTSDELEIMQDS